MCFKYILILLLTSVVNCLCVSTLINESVLYGISYNSQQYKNLSKCYQDLDNLYESINNQRIWALKALDASGRPESGFLYGNNLWIGSHTQCMDIMNKKPFEINLEKNKHIDATDYDYPPYELSFAMALIQHNSTLQYHTQQPLEFTIQLGLCIPSSCTKNELANVLMDYLNSDHLTIKNLYNLNFNLTEIRILEEDGGGMLQLPKTIILIVIAMVVIVLTIAGTVYDVRQHNRAKILIKGPLASNKNVSEEELVGAGTIDEQRSTFGEVLKCFSIYSNVKNLVKTKLTSDSVSIIHGLRFLSMLWVIMIHSIFYQTDYLENVPYGYRLSEDIFSQILSNSTYCVDSYLFFSGFLVAYLFYKSRNGKVDDLEEKVNYRRKIQQFFMMFINRFLRLTPIYLFVLLFTNVMYTYYRKSSALYSSEKPDILCDKYWWRNLLYINNLYPRSEMCMSWSWYLSIDTQCFAISTFLLILSTCAFKTSASILLGLIAVNVGATAYKSYSIRYIPTMDEQLVQLDAIYDLPWNRMGPYLIGIITGYIFMIKLKKTLVLTEKKRLLLWTIFPLINLWILFTLYTRKLSVEFSAVYMGISRTLWGVGLGWLVIACCTGNARAVEKFLSFKGFIPLSRLTYCAYLLNPLVANMLYLGSESTFSASKASFSLTVGGVTFITFYLSFMFSMLFESPFIRLTKLGFEKLRQRRPKDENTPPSA